MSSVNKVMLVGNVGKDPEIRRTQDGTPVASFSVATSEKWKDKSSGERKERTEWHNVVVFNEQLAGVVENYVKKGAKVYVEGALQTRKWTDKNGQDRYSTEVVLQKFRGEIQLLDKLDREEGQEPEERRPASRSNGKVDYDALPRPTPSRSGSAASLDDSIPFRPEFR